MRDADFRTSGLVAREVHPSLVYLGCMSYMKNEVRSLRLSEDTNTSDVTVHGFYLDILGVLEVYALDGQIFRRELFRANTK